MFRNRGSVPNINNNIASKNGFKAPHYSNYWNGNMIVVNYDKDYLLIELISTLIIIVISIAALFFAYKMPFEDPIASTKKTFLTLQLSAIVFSVISTGFVLILTQSTKEALIKGLKTVVLISVLLLIILFGLKQYYNSIYTKETFENFYEQSEYSKSTNKKINQLTIGSAGIKIQTPKELYIEESQKGYTYFTIKLIYLLLFILLQY